MMAAFGGSEIRRSGYARDGTAELSAEVVRAMDGRNGCRMASHGMLTAGPEDLTRAAWLAHELGTLAHHYFFTSCRSVEATCSLTPGSPRPLEASRATV